MLFGNSELFAIDCRLIGKEGRWVFVNFRFWIGGKAIGDYEDSADLRGIVENFTDHFSFYGDLDGKCLDDKAKDEVFDIVFDSNTQTVPEGKTLSELVDCADNFRPKHRVVLKEARESYHLDGVGMSAFQDKVNIIRVPCVNGEDRIIWRDLSSMNINEARLPKNYFQQVANEFIIWASALLDKPINST